MRGKQIGFYSETDVAVGMVGLGVYFVMKLCNADGSFNFAHNQRKSILGIDQGKRCHS